MEKEKDITKQPKYPINYVQVLRGGTAHIILFSDDKKYVVKWHGTTKERGEILIYQGLPLLFSVWRLGGPNP
jgi:hypothetical protein